MKKLILLAATVFFLLAPFTYHPDTKLVLYYPTLNNSKVWDIYTYLNQHQDDAPKFHYPPMHYWLLKSELPLVKLVGGNGVVEWLGSNGNSAFRTENIFLFNLATKLPLLILVLLSGWLIGEILKKQGYSEKTALKAAAIWFFNPVTLYSAVVMGQNDILALFPFILGMWFYFDKPIIAFTLFGLAGSIKSYPLLWALILAMIYPKRSWLKRFFLAMIPMFVYIATMAPFLKLPYFREEVLYSGLSVRMFDGAIDIGLGDKLLIVPTLLVLVTLIGISKKSGENLKKVGLILLSSTLVILGFTHFHPQWFIWLMPFAAMSMAISSKRWWVWLTLPALAGIILLFNDKFLYWGLLGPLNPNLINLPVISEWLQIKGVDIGLLNNLCHSIIAGIAGYSLFDCFKNEK